MLLFLVEQVFLLMGRSGQILLIKIIFFSRTTVSYLVFG